MAVIARLQTILTANTRGFGSAMHNANRQLASFGKTARVFASAAGLGGAAIALDRMVKRGGDVINISRAFNNAFRGQAGGVERLREASHGLISDYDLMKQANNAVALGAANTIDEFAKLTETSIALGRAFGVDAAHALFSLSIGIGRQSRLVLDNVGIIVKAEDAYGEYARQLGITVDQMSLAEKKQAFLTAAMEAADAAVGKFGKTQTTFADAIRQTRVEFRNLLDTVLKQIVEQLGVQLKDAAVTLAQKFREWNTVLENNHEIIGRVVQVTLALIEFLGVGLGNVLETIITLARTAARMFIAVWKALSGDVKGAVDIVKENFVSLKDRMVENVKEMKEAWDKFIDSLTKDLPKIKKKIEEDVVPQPDDIRDALTEFKQLMARTGFDAGERFINGLIEGITEGRLDLKKLLGRLVGDFLKAFAFFGLSRIPGLGPFGAAIGLGGGGPGFGGQSVGVARLGSGTGGVSLNVNLSAPTNPLAMARDAEWQRALRASLRVAQSDGFAF